MRTTVTLDPDTERLLRQAMHQTGQGFKSTLNQAIRKGLADVVSAVDEEPFVVEAHDMGLCPGVDVANIHDLENDLDVEAYLEVTRSLRQGRPISTSSEKRSQS